MRDLWALRLQILSAALPEYQSSSSQTARQTYDDPDDDPGFSSQSSYLYTSDSDAASTTKSARGRRRRRHVPRPADRPKIIETVTLCYLGALMLRSSLALSDLHRWIETNELPYNGSIRQLPAALREKLSAEYWQALDPRARLARGRLCRAVNHMAVQLHERFGITFPPLNREVMLLRMVNELGLPRRFP